MRSSIIVVTYNHRHDIERCLQAVLPTLGPEDEVTVVDNASRDGTADYIASKFTGVRLLRSRDNGGFGAACNRAARQSGAEFLVFLNPDTQVCSAWLNALIGPLRTMRGVGLVTPKLLLRQSPELIDAFGHDVHITGIATCRGWGRPRDAFTRAEAVPAVSGACFAISRTLFEELGGFDERLFLYYEDDDLSLRARLAGHGCIATPNAVVLHDHSPGISADKLRYLERNRWWSLLKLLEVRTLISMAPALLMSELVAWVMAIRGGPDFMSAKVRAWWDVLSWLPALRSSRSAVQRTRAISDAQLWRSHTARLHLAQVASGPGPLVAEWAITLAFRGAMLVTSVLSGALKWARLGGSGVL